MKIIRKNFAIVELSDIRYIGILPVNVVEQLKTFYERTDKYEIFKNQQAINFFKEKTTVPQPTYRKRKK